MRMLIVDFLKEELFRKGNSLIKLLYLIIQSLVLTFKRDSRLQ